MHHRKPPPQCDPPRLAKIEGVPDPAVQPAARRWGPPGALDSALPSVVFVITYLVTGSNLTVALVAALVALRSWPARLIRREKPVRVVGGLAAVAFAAVVAARTGNAADYFLPSLLANVASALIWAASILARWPLLGSSVSRSGEDVLARRPGPDARLQPGVLDLGGVVPGPGRGQPAAVLTDNLVGLGISRVLLGFPMVLGVIAAVGGSSNALYRPTTRGSLPRVHRRGSPEHPEI